MGALGMAGLAGLAGTLGKMAYDETKKDMGVPMTPMTMLGPVGRFNIEAEIARRMGQEAPNPVEFGLLPQGTFPELSGGRPLESEMMPSMGVSQPPVMEPIDMVDPRPIPKRSPRIEQISPLDAVDDLGVPIFGGRDIPIKKDLPPIIDIQPLEEKFPIQPPVIQRPPSIEYIPQVDLAREELLPPMSLVDAEGNPFVLRHSEQDPITGEVLNNQPFGNVSPPPELPLTNAELKEKILSGELPMSMAPKPDMQPELTVGIAPPNTAPPRIVPQFTVDPIPDPITGDRYPVQPMMPIDMPINIPQIAQLDIPMVMPDIPLGDITVPPAMPAVQPMPMPRRAVDSIRPRISRRRGRGVGALRRANGGAIMNYEGGGSAKKYPNEGLEALARVAPNVVKRMGYAGGGPIYPMAYAEGGNVSMEDFERMNGGINGAGTETSDDIPAMLSDGEFVMTGQAVRGAGSYEMAQDNKGIISLIPSLSEDRERGTKLMYDLMDAFDSKAGRLS